MAAALKKLIIASNIKNLYKVRKFVEESAEKHGFSDEQIFDMKVAIGEAASNAIEHGSPKGDASKVKVTSEFNGKEIIFKVADEGSFRPAVPIDDPSFHHRGRGISFMLALMDEVTINEGEAGTIVRLAKKLQPGES